MIAIYFLILLSILAAVGFLAGFIWSVRTGQYEDTSTPPLRLLTDDATPRGASPKISIPNPKENQT